MSSVVGLEPALDAGAEEPEREQRQGDRGEHGRGWRKSSGGRGTPSSLAAAVEVRAESRWKAVLSAWRRRPATPPEYRFQVLWEVGSKRMRALGAALAVCLVAGVFLGAQSNAALIKVGSLVLKAEGSFKPWTLPRHGYAPNDFQGHANLINTQGGPPTQLEEFWLDFDRNEKLDTQGLPVCPQARIAHLNVGQARRKCAGALVGTGHVGATMFFLGVPVNVRLKASLFNGPPKHGDATVIGHTYSLIPTPRAYTVVIPIETRPGAYRYRTRIDVTKLTGEGILTHIDGHLGARFDYRGHEHSYISGRCRNGLLKIHGHFRFTDGTIMDGALEKACSFASP